MTDAVHTDFNRNVHALLGLPFDAVTLHGAIDRLRKAMKSREPCLWVTPNVNFVVAARSDASFRSAILKSHLSTVDGMPLVWLARGMGIPLPERVSGSDVFDGLLCQSDTDATVQTVFLFGGDDGVAEIAHRNLNARSANLRSVGWLSPGRGSVEALSRPEYLVAMRNSCADFLLVSLGAVKGHMWLDRNWREVGTPVVSHLGAVINFLAGSVRRAPTWMQRTGLEWMWRIRQENALWSRYLNDGKALFHILRKSVFSYIKLQRKWRSSTESHPPILFIGTESDRLVWSLSGVFLADSLNELRRVCDGLNHQPADLILDASDLVWLDSAAMGLLLLLHSHQVQTGRALQWRGDGIKQIVAAHGCSHLIDHQL